MQLMFYVRYTPQHAHRPCHTPPHDRTHASQAVPPHCGPCLVRQDASAFNQPLAWNVSSVHSMRKMFVVRFTRHPTPPRASHLS